MFLLGSLIRDSNSGLQTTIFSGETIEILFKTLNAANLEETRGTVNKDCKAVMEAAYSSGATKRELRIAKRGD